jgi:starch synthase
MAGVAKILMVSSEAAPFAKTGGLSDVVGALPRALRELGHEVVVVIPRYAQTRQFPGRRIWDELPVWLGGTAYRTSVVQSYTDPAYLFLDCPPLYGRNGLYQDERGDFPDNHVRFALLARGALEVARSIFLPDVIHMHDWQAALVPLYMKTVLAGDPTFAGIRTLLTIHNLGYQGVFPASVMPEIDVPATEFHPQGVEFFGQINFLKAGLAYSDALNTVSRKYAEEIQTPEFGFALDGVLRERRGVLSGILNGVDYNRWNPETDTHLAAQYSDQDLTGKLKCKKALLREFGLPEAAVDRPLIGIVSRFTSQKGADLIAAVGDQLFAEDVYFVALGNGEPEYELLFRELAARYPGRAAVYIGYDEAMSHRIEAGADIFLMPSRYEPCGLNQIYSLRYGTVPVVRATGGLDDTIDESTGFKFQEYTGAAMLAAVRLAVAAYQDRTSWAMMMVRGMRKDFSWSASAREYSGLYDTLLNPKGPGII